jgi:hypothetical protein
MSATCTICGVSSALFKATAAAVRQLNKARQFNRTAAAKPLIERTADYWCKGDQALFEYLTETEAWAAIQRQVILQSAAAKAVRKTLSDSDRKLLMDLIANFDYYSGADQVAKTIVEACYFDTFEAAAQFALGQIGVKAADFELKNESLRQFILDRGSAPALATRNHIDATLDTIVSHFCEQGRSPVDGQFLEDLRQDLGYKTEYEARRFALTETGIVAEKAQFETYQRNGVTGKRWNVRGVNTRPSHQDQAGVEVAIDKKWKLVSEDGSVHEAAHPLDPNLPASELVNCHCWMSPVIDDSFDLDTSKIWEGA